MLRAMVIVVLAWMGTRCAVGLVGEDAVVGCQRGWASVSSPVCGSNGQGEACGGVRRQVGLAWMWTRGAAGEDEVDEKDRQTNEVWHSTALGLAQSTQPPSSHRIIGESDSTQRHTRPGPLLSRSLTSTETLCSSRTS